MSKDQDHDKLRFIHTVRQFTRGSEKEDAGRSDKLDIICGCHKSNEGRENQHPAQYLGMMYKQQCSIAQFTDKAHS